MTSESWSSAVIAQPDESYEEWVIRMGAWDEELPEIQPDSEDVDEEVAYDPENIFDDPVLFMRVWGHIYDEDFIGGTPDPSEVDEEEVFEAEDVDDDKDADEDTDSF
jgi:hypothetical protein